MLRFLGTAILPEPEAWWQRGWAWAQPYWLWGVGTLIGLGLWWGWRPDKAQQRKEAAEKATESEPERKARVRLAAEQKAQEVSGHFPRQVDALTGSTFIQLPGNSDFKMGSPLNEAGRNENEGKEGPHRVAITPFWIATTAVTVGQFRRFVESTGYGSSAEENAGGKKGCFSRSEGGGAWAYVEGRCWQNPGYRQQENHPVTCVSYLDVMAYLEWLNQQAEGKSYRLPTEAEWEYACRGNTTTARFWGDNPDEACDYANVACQNRQDGVRWQTYHNCDTGFNLGTSPVGHFAPNPFGLYDMLGNVWEWTCSGYDDKYQNNLEISCKNRADSGLRAGRGGSWDNIPARVRAASRDGSNPDTRGDSLGFRLVLPPR
ncbi:formylglycine-generating enzyme family protein [Ectothiorhodospiraceae bacterium BW-2]|nr:formylglycine-generating enzyme family protein [Ectothiorhodospiraceae bacterium BW-2]